jgi:geranylgeranyl pyrophosphate synthase
MDLYEKKKTLPILRLYDLSALDEKNKLNIIYKNTSPMESDEIDYIYNLLEKYDIRNFISKEIKQYFNKFNKLVDSLLISSDNKKALISINNSLFLEENR